MYSTHFYTPLKLWLNNCAMNSCSSDWYYLYGEDANVPVGEYVVNVEELERGPGGLKHQDQEESDDREPEIIAPT
jgi:hypothetical protein